MTRKPVTAADQLIVQSQATEIIRELDTGQKCAEFLVAAQASKVTVDTVWSQCPVDDHGSRTVTS